VELLPPQGRQRDRSPARSRGGGSGSGEGGGGSLALALDESRRPRRGPFELPSLRLELEDGAVEVGDAVGVGVVGGAAAVWESRERERERVGRKRKRKRKRKRSERQRNEQSMALQERKESRVPSAPSLGSGGASNRPAGT
jgi:hypothetical protein